MTARSLALEILPQPDDSTCGPTCLHAVYRYFGDDLPLESLIAEIPSLETGGTLAVNLANHALARGYGARIYTYNLSVFDPTWFGADAVDLAERLGAQAKVKPEPRLAQATGAYLEFLRRGGELSMEDLSPELLHRTLVRDRPILTGLSATFLYRCAREIGNRELHEDDVRGLPVGHFVVLSGWDAGRRVRIADPLEDNPGFGEHIYWLPVDRVINAILLGVLTYDANLLVLEPPDAR